MSAVCQKKEINEWLSVCQESDLILNIGVCILLGERQVALFKIDNGDIYAIDNYDPFSDANVLSRGICGDIKGQVVVTSPIYKQHFNLSTGQCLEDKDVFIPSYNVRLVNGTVQLAE